MNMEFLSMKPYVNPHQLAIFFKRGYVMKTGLFVGEKHVFVEIIFFSEAYREFLNLLFQPLSHLFPLCHGIYHHN